MATIPSSNLYQNGRIIQFDSGEQILIRDLLKLTDFDDVEYHTVKQDEELTQIAYDNYHTKIKDASKYWWVIADVNNIFNPFDITDLLGFELVIPNILEVKNLKK